MANRLPDIPVDELDGGGQLFYFDRKTMSAASGSMSFMTTFTTGPIGQNSVEVVKRIVRRLVVRVAPDYIIWSDCPAFAFATVLFYRIRLHRSNPFGATLPAVSAAREHLVHGQFYHG